MRVLTAKFQIWRLWKHENMWSYFYVGPQSSFPTCNISKMTAWNWRNGLKLSYLHKNVSFSKKMIEKLIWFLMWFKMQFSYGILNVHIHVHYYSKYIWNSEYFWKLFTQLQRNSSSCVLYRTWTGTKENASLINHLRPFRPLDTYVSETKGTKRYVSLCPFSSRMVSNWKTCTYLPTCKDTQ